MGRVISIITSYDLHNYPLSDLQITGKHKRTKTMYVESSSIVIRESALQVVVVK